MKPFAFWVLFLVSVSACWSQEFSKKAIKITEKGAEALKARDFNLAIDLFQNAIQADPKYPLPYLRLGNFYAAYLQKDTAVYYYNKYADLSGIDNVTRDLREKIARLNFETGRYDQAFRLIEGLSEPDSLLMKSIMFSLEAKRKPISVDITPLSREINQYVLQYFPVLTVDEETIIYTKRNGLEPSYDEDIVVSKKVNGKWESSHSISPSINSNYNEGACTISADGRVLIFTSCEGRKSYGNCDLYISVKTGATWSKPENLGPKINSRFWDSQPSLSADGRVLYFSSNRPGGIGGRDIWFSRLGVDGWEEPINLGSSINTVNDETTPFVHVNGKQLFYSSNGLPGLGGFDLFTSQRLNGEWQKPQNLGFPINSFRDELSLFINRFGNRCYYASEEYKDGKMKSSEIVSFQLESENLIKIKSGYVIGSVIDSKTKEPLLADVRVTNLMDSAETYFVKSDSANGKFFLVLNEHSEYGVFVSKKGYLFDDYTFVITSNQMDQPDSLKIPLRKMNVGESLTVDNIYFEVNSSELNGKSFAELSEIARFLEENSESHFLIQGHTDNSGNDQFNMKLSEERARTVYNYLIKSGISVKRLRFQGFGSRFPISDNSSEEGRRINRRITFELINIQ